MGSRCAGAGFTENISKIMVVQRDTTHVDQSIVRSGFVGEEKLIDLSVIHLRETGKGCDVDERDFWRNKGGQRRWSFR